MNPNSLILHLRHCLLWLFHKNNAIKGTTAAKEICQVYGDDSIADRTCQKWLNNFRTGNKNIEDLDDEPRSGRPSNLDEMKLINLVENDPKVTIRELAAYMNSSFGTIQRHLHELGFVSKLGQWVPHKLSQTNKDNRVKIATELLQRHEEGLLSLDSIVTGDEKWVLYVNVTRRREWRQSNEAPSPIAKAGLHPKKCLLSLFWDTEGIIHWEILPKGKTINSKVYCEQLDRLNAALKEKRPHKGQILFLHDNASPHVSKATKAHIAQLGWEILHKLSYSKIVIYIKIYEGAY